MWVGGVADFQTRFQTLKKKQIAPKIAFFNPNFTFRFPKSHKNTGVGGWVNRFGKGFYTFPIKGTHKKKYFVVRLTVFSLRG